ncbi:MAG: di-heme-cytochrome C peroxidase [Bauldia sp.]
MPPPRPVAIDQNVDAATLTRYHHTDQGTRLLPAAWLAAIEKPDGSGKVMDPDDLRQYGFIVDGIEKSAANPFGWPLGFTVSDPKLSGGVSIAGVTCAMCHTGQIDFKGKAVRIEGGQAMVDLYAFADVVAEAFIATATNQALRNKFLTDAVAAGYPADRMEKDFGEAVAYLGSLKQKPAGAKIVSTVGGPGRVDAVQAIANRAFGTDLLIPANQRDLVSPVSYPFLWDIWRLTWLQYNGFMPPKAVSRNVGEVLGVFGKTNIVNAKGELNPEPLRWQTSLQLDNLLWMEKTLEGLHAPTWPADVLGPIDQAKADAGKQLFTGHCSGCHGIKTLPDGMWDVSIVPLDHVGTDPNQATSWAKNTYDLSILGLGKNATASMGVPAAVNAIRRQLYADNKTPAAEQEGDATVTAPCGYKARPLIGVWATPPFLHNGSVRTVFELLSDTRPATFKIGSREYDPAKLGYIDDQGLGGMVFDTSADGNGNAGHWWTDDMSRPGRIGPKLSDDDKYAIIEFLKSATYDNYPSEKRDTPAKVACADNPDWAMAK